MLERAGFGSLNFYAATPDYKLPQKIFEIKENTSGFNDFICDGGWIEEHDGSNGKILNNQEEMKFVYKKLAKENVAHLFAPSYYIVASE